MREVVVSPIPLLPSIVVVTPSLLLATVVGAEEAAELVSITSLVGSEEAPDMVSVALFSTVNGSPQEGVGPVGRSRESVVEGVWAARRGVRLSSVKRVVVVNLRIFLCLLLPFEFCLLPSA